MVKNIVKAVERCGLKIDQLILAGLASSYAVLTEEERELEVCVGYRWRHHKHGGLYCRRAALHQGDSLCRQRDHQRHRLCLVGTPPTDAEVIQVRYGCALGLVVSKNESVEVPSVGG